jgi:hypothetical protein
LLCSKLHLHWPFPHFLDENKEVVYVHVRFSKTDQ